MMDRQSHRGTSILSSQVTSTVTVTLVLLMLGIVALLSIGARNVAVSLDSDAGFTVVVAETATPEGSCALGEHLKAAPYSANVVRVTADEVLDRWNGMIGMADSTLEENPFLEEWEVTVTSAYTAPDSLDKIMAAVSEFEEVGEVSSRVNIAREVHDTLDVVLVVLLAVAVALMIISFVLINNTVRLSVYSRRHTIHAMWLVGATRGFIRRPFVMGALYSGLIAAGVATAVLGGALYYMFVAWPPSASAISWSEAGMVAISLFVAGVLLCVVAAAAATNKHLSGGYDSLFK